MKTTLLLFVFPINLRTSEEHLERKSASFYVSLPPLTPSLAVAFIPSLARICTAACCYQIWRSIFKGSLLKFFFEVCIYIPIYSTLTTMKLSLNDFYLQYPFWPLPPGTLQVKLPSQFSLTSNADITYGKRPGKWLKTDTMEEGKIGQQRDPSASASLPPDISPSFLDPLWIKYFGFSGQIDTSCCPNLKILGNRRISPPSHSMFCRVLFRWREHQD